MPSRSCSSHALFLSLALAGGSLLASPGRAVVDARLLRFPDVSATQVVFVFGGDVWIVPREGGTASRLSTPPGQEIFPRFSPDGTQVAFSGNHDGNVDVYVMPSGGGLPVRLTHHPAQDLVLDWHPDGSAVLFASDMTSGNARFRQLWLAPQRGGLPTRLPVPYGEFGSLSDDGTTLAYVPISQDFATWKRYRGGSNPDLWLFNLETKASRRLAPDPANDSLPIWHGSTVYFLSDRGTPARANIWAFDTAAPAATPRQVTHFTDFDVHFPSGGPLEIVFEAGGTLHLLDFATEKLRAVPVTVVTDLATVRPRVVDAASLVRAISVSPNASRIALGARGEVFSVPAEHGVVLNMTRTSGVAERFPAWSPDGKTIAVWSDRTGEYELTFLPADGKGEVRTVTKLGPGFRYDLHWSPDSKHLAFVDQSMMLRIVEAQTGKVTDVKRGSYLMHGELEGFPVSWSADGRWLAFAMDHEGGLTAIFVHDLRDERTHRLTSAATDDSQPVFDPEGKYLYFLTSRTFQPSYSDVDTTFIYANTTNVLALPLRADVASPLAVRNDMEEDEHADEKGAKSGKASKSKDKSKSKSKDDDEEAEDADEPPAAVTLDLDGIERRAVVLPIATGRLADLGAVKGRVLYRRLPRSGAADDAKASLVYYDLEEREEKTIAVGVDGYEIAAGGEMLLVAADKKLHVVEVEADLKLEKPVPDSPLEMMLDPRAEWRQLFADAWRLERDYFYDPGLHGVDWNGLRERYGALIEDSVTRFDVNHVIGELIGELCSSHAYRGGGDVEASRDRGVGLLGADFTFEQGACRIAHVVRGAAWDTEVRSPLEVPGAEVKEGEFLLAVNGVPLDVTQDPWAAFQGLAGKTVQLTVNARPEMKGARDVVVETLASETRLRYLAWVEGNRRRVEEVSAGRVGYIHVPDTGTNGQTELVRHFGAESKRDGLIVDERFNGGGQIPDRFVELLDRPRRNKWAVRDGRDWSWPPVAHEGPKVMLINNRSGSGGDAFPFYFKQSGLGPLIGTRTWGGLIGISGTPQLIDGGGVTAPTFAIYSTDGQWIIENHGVDPDIEVIDDPALMQDGRDPQLERAIAEVLAALAKNPPQTLPRPPYPQR